IDLRNCLQSKREVSRTWQHELAPQTVLSQPRQILQSQYVSPNWLKGRRAQNPSAQYIVPWLNHLPMFSALPRFRPAWLRICPVIRGKIDEQMPSSSFN